MRWMSECLAKFVRKGDDEQKDLVTTRGTAFSTMIVKALLRVNCIRIVWTIVVFALVFVGSATRGPTKSVTPQSTRWPTEQDLVCIVEQCCRTQQTFHKLLENNSQSLREVKDFQPDFLGPSLS